MNISNEEIVSLAALQRKMIDLESLGDHVSPSDMDVFKKSLDHLSSAVGFVLLMAARNLLEGKPYCITSDNPGTISRCRSLAEHMGASVDEFREVDGLTKIILGPPSRQ
jgi:hypothetical protein